MTTGTDRDIVTLLRTDHDDIRTLLAHVGCGDPDRRREGSHRLRGLVIRHEVAEELVVYPALLARPGGAAVARSRLADQERIEEQLIALDRTGASIREFTAGSTRLVLDLLGHLDTEESQVLPLLATGIGARRRTVLGQRFLEVKGLAPLRRVAPGVRVPAGPTIVDGTSAVAIWLRDCAAARTSAS